MCELELRILINSKRPFLLAAIGKRCLSAAKFEWQTLWPTASFASPIAHIRALFRLVSGNGAER
jgi:hypothetical protein